MSKWKCEICGSEFENFHAQGFNHKIYCPLCYFKKKNQELKKQLKEWKHHLKCSKEMLDIQGQKGNYDYDEYMLGLYNGMEYIIALFETREPKYINGKDVKFTSNKSQQKDFIKYLEDEKDRLIKETSHYYIDSFDRQHAVNETIYDEVDIILQKYKEIIGDDKKISFEKIEELTCGTYDFETQTINLLIKNQKRLIDEINKIKENR